jgi:uncharacterized protein YbjT (DUF2867 family)
MTTAVIGATGRVGSQIVRGVLARGDAVTALVRDPGKARRAFGEPGGLHIRPTRLDDPRDLTEALDGIRTVFIAMGSTGIEGVLQRIAINAAAGIGSIEQVTRLSVLNASADSLGINQRAHDSIDQFAASTAVPYSTIRPAIFSASLLAAAPEVRASRTWTGLASRGRMALIDHRDAAGAGLRVLTDPALWGAHHDLTGPAAMSWPEALELLSAELGEPVTFRVAAERQLLERLTAPGYRQGRLSCSSRASGRSWPGRTTTRPAPSARSPAAPRARSPSSSTTTAPNSPGARASSPPDPAGGFLAMSMIVSAGLVPRTPYPASRTGPRPPGPPGASTPASGPRCRLPIRLDHPVVV